MSAKKPITLFFLMTAALVASAEVTVVNGRKYECKDGVCMLVEEDAVPPLDKDGSSLISGGDAASPLERVPRVAQGYMSAEEFVAFLENREKPNPFAGTGVWLTLLLVLLGGLAMNLTPCVLPMIPINLMIIGRSAKRGAAYGFGMTVAYGALGVAAALGGLAFGSIQGNPWFNAAVAAVFVVLALALFDLFFIDFSRFRPTQTSNPEPQTSNLKPQTLFFPFFMGALASVLAGACVAPVLISVLLLTTDWVAAGHRMAVLLPFVMGLGMALPWPFLGAGLRVLPKPGIWMKQVNRLFGLIVVGFAVYYGGLAWKGFRPPAAERGGGRVATPATLPTVLSARRLSQSPQPILFDCWASWCKNCTAMERRVMPDAKVRRALESYEVIRVQAEDVSELRRVKGFESVRGLPAFVIFE